MSTSGPGEQLKKVIREQVEREVINSSEQQQEMEVEITNQGQDINLNTKKQHEYKYNKGVICFVYLLKILCFAIVACMIVGFVAILTGSTQSPSNGQRNENKTQAVQDKVSKDLQISKIETKNIEQTFATNNLRNTQKQEVNQKQKNELFNKISQHETTSKMKRQNIKLVSNISDFFAVPQYSIPITDFPPFHINNQPIDHYGIGNDIQIGSIYDYLNITDSPQFTAFKQNWNKSIEFQKYQFEYNSSLDAQPSILQYSSFKDSQQMQNQLNQLGKWQGKQPLGSDLPLYLSCHLLWNSSSVALKELELFYLTKKYNLNRYQEQLPFCIFSTGYKIASRQRHIYVLDSIERQNYTNYHVVAVDDNSPDSTAQTMYEYLKQGNMKLKNKIQIIKNKVNLGATMSTYYWARQLCKPGEIIVHIDMDDMLLGNQVLKVLNSLYHNHNTWYVYTRYLRQDNPMMTPNAGKSRAPNFKVKQYRHKIDWRTSALRTLRYEVMSNIPIEAVVQYHYDRDLKILFPKFYDTDADRFLIYPQLQLCGDHRIRYIDDVFYYYNISYNVANKCNMRHQHFDEYKSRIKRRYEPMRQINDTNIFWLEEQEVPMNVTKNLKDRYKKLMACLKQKNMGDRSITKNRNV